MLSVSDEISRDGFSIQRQVFSLSDFQPLFERLIDYYKMIAGVQESAIRWQDFPPHIFDLAKAHPEKRRYLYTVSQLAPEMFSLVNHPKLKNILTQAGVLNPVLKNTNIRMDIAGLDQFLIGWHQDLNNLTAKKSVTVWLPLQNLDDATGGLGALPISKQSRAYITPVRDGLYQDFQIEKDDEPKVISAHMTLGDAFIFRPQLVHRSLKGSGAGVRWTLIMRFDCLNTFFDLTGETPVTPVHAIEDPYLKTRGAQELYPSARK